MDQSMSTARWVKAYLEWADESGSPVGLNGLFSEEEEEKAIDQSMSSARWVKAYLEWADESGNVVQVIGSVVHVEFGERRKFDRRVAHQQHCGYARRASDRQAAA